ncbi:helix-turn-helix domain-containing protein [Oceanobacillus oncorhynchi]|uniref:helix-turn-helix domain-containing protein n=1 Tax=Oceanobacillus oncorhynchi TaxID=545501 RepID=UPI001865C435|nr:helix-turn-helix transcriptional regulator [Oceanobacillus oncorhynchi]
MNTFSHRLKKAREKAGLKQIEASKLLCISNSTLSCYERAYRDPDSNTLHRIAEIYGVSTDWLLGKSPHSSIDALMYRKWIHMSEEEKQEALNVIQYILHKRY